MRYTPPKKAGYSAQQVERLKALVKKSTTTVFEIGDLILERPDATREEIEALGEPAGQNYDQLASYRYVSSRYDLTERRADISWTVHRELAVQDDRLAILNEGPIWTLRTVRERLGRTPIDQKKDAAPRELTATERVQVARRVMSDPTTARQALEDPQVHRATIEASAEAFVDRSKRESPNWSRSARSEQPTDLGRVAAFAALEDGVARSMRVLDATRAEFESKGVELDANQKEVFEQLLDQHTARFNLLRLAALNESISDTELSELMNGR